MEKYMSSENRLYSSVNDSPADDLWVQADNNSLPNFEEFASHLVIPSLQDNKKKRSFASMLAASSNNIQQNEPSRQISSESDVTPSKMIKTGNNKFVSIASNSSVQPNLTKPNTSQPNFKPKAFIANQDKENVPVVDLKTVKTEPKAQNTTESTEKQVPDLGLRIITGNVQFALDIRKNHSGMNALIEIIAQVFKIVPGKYKKEMSILLRAGESGPVLQGTYYPFHEWLPVVKAGDAVRCIGKFMGEAQRYRIEKIAVANDDNLKTAERLAVISKFIVNTMPKKVAVIQNTPKLTIS